MNRLLLAAAICLATGSAPVLGCEGKTIIFEDNFRDATGGWVAGSHYSIENGLLTIHIKPDVGGRFVLNGTFPLKDADICADVVFPTTGADLNPALGIVFWMADDTAYSASINQKGELFVRKYFNKSWNTIVNQPVKAIRTNPEAENRIRVVLKGNLITVYVNREKIRETKAPAPSTPSTFGITTLRDKNGTDQAFIVKAVKVTTAD